MSADPPDDYDWRALAGMLGHALQRHLTANCDESTHEDATTVGAWRIVERRAVDAEKRAAAQPDVPKPREGSNGA